MTCEAGGTGEVVRRSRWQGPTSTPSHVGDTRSVSKAVREGVWGSSTWGRLSWTPWPSHGLALLPVLGLLPSACQGHCPTLGPSESFSTGASWGLSKSVVNVSGPVGRLDRRQGTGACEQTCVHSPREGARAEERRHPPLREFPSGRWPCPSGSQRGCPGSCPVRGPVARENVPWRGFLRHLVT